MRDSRRTHSSATRSISTLKSPCVMAVVKPRIRSLAAICAAIVFAPNVISSRTRYFDFLQAISLYKYASIALCTLLLWGSK